MVTVPDARATQAITDSLGGRRSDAGAVRLTSRDITGLALVGDMHAAPYNLLTAALAVNPRSAPGDHRPVAPRGAGRADRPGPPPRLVLAHPGGDASRRAPVPARPRNPPRPRTPRR